jgi:hypothetical protein
VLEKLQDLVNGFALRELVFCVLAMEVKTAARSLVVDIGDRSSGVVPDPGEAK